MIEKAPELDIIDEVAQLLLHADAGDNSAEDDLWHRYQQDDRLHPGDQVMTYSPYGLPPRRTNLQASDQG